MGKIKQYFDPVFSEDYKQLCRHCGGAGESLYPSEDLKGSVLLPCNHCRGGIERKIITLDKTSPMQEFLEKLPEILKGFKNE